ncbi:hypothetical protein ACF07U_28995 [Streptomyces californicus]|uniref:hypothetical protein n=1 Tax=Streptomyces californicus TaxID=67351 RepID=UPI0036F4C7D5
MNAAYVLEALHDEEVLARTRDAMAQGRAQTETDLLLALTGFATLIELRVIDPQDVLKAVDQHLDRLFDQ